MAMYFAAWLTALSVAACGSNGSTARDAAPNDSGGADGGRDAVLAGPPEWQSGTRLRARVFDGGGGAALFSTWFDTERNVECSWMQTGDGTFRCLPRQVSVAFLLYADAGCTTTRVVMESDCAPASTYVTFLETDQRNPTVYSVGAALPTPTPVLFEAGPGGCVESTFGQIQGYHFANAALVANEQFVAATLSREPRGTQLAADVFATADGARDRRSIVDATRNSHCRNLDGQLDGQPCLPVRALFAGPLFAEATCTTHVAVAPGAMQPFLDEPSALVRTRSQAYYEVGTPYTGPLFQLNSTCNVFPPEQIGNTPRWLLGAAVPLSSLPAILTTDESHAGLHVVATTSASGERLRGARFSDPAFNADCYIHVASDNQTRCMAGSMFGSLARYRDASCTQLMLQLYTGNSASFVPPTRVIDLGEGACYQTNVATAYPVGAALPATTVGYRRDGNTCEAVAADVNFAYFETPGPAPASASPLISIRTE